MNPNSLTYHSSIANVGSIEKGEQVEHGHQGNKDQVELEKHLAVERGKLLLAQVGIFIRRSSIVAVLLFIELDLFEVGLV